MAKWNFIVSGNQLIKELVVTDNDTDPRSESFMQPSFDLQGGKIVMKESGQYKTAIYFSQIGTIGGETPTDIEDAYDKLIALVSDLPNVQQYKFLLSQSGGDDPQTATSGSLTQGVTYEIVAFETGDDFIPSGAPNNTVGTKWIANGVSPTWANGSEIGWNGGAPVISGDVTPNGIGNIWFEFLSDGTYFVKSDALFIVGKTFFNIILNVGAFGAADRPTSYQLTASDSIISIETVADTGGGVVYSNDVIAGAFCELITYN